MAGVVGMLVVGPEDTLVSEAGPGKPGGCRLGGGLRHLNLQSTSCKEKCVRSS